MAILLRSGCTLPEALKFAGETEHGSPAGVELSAWRARLSEGQGGFGEFAKPGKSFPPMFLWFINSGGNDLAAGFQRAAEIYQDRARYRSDMLLYAVMPFSVLVLAIIIFDQIYTIIFAFIRFMTVTIRMLS
jgi:type II secretory pathway component PulF